MLARRGIQANELTESHRAREVLGSSPDNRNTPPSPSEPQPVPPRTCNEPNCLCSSSTSESASATSSSIIRQAQGKDHHKHLHKHLHHHHHHEWDNLPGITSEAEVLRQIQMQQQQRDQQREHHDWDNLPGITSEAEVLRQMQQREQQRERGQEQNQQSQSQGQQSQGQGHEVQGGNNNEPKQVTLEEGQQAGGSIPRDFSREASGQALQDKGKQREGDSPNRGRAASSTGKSHETNVGSWSHSRERRRSSAEDEAGAGRGGAAGGAAERSTEGYDPNNYDRGAYVETSRVGME